MSDIPPFEHPAYRWEPWRSVTIHKSGGPERVVTDDPDPAFVPRPVGFTAQIPPVSIEPKTWEGDDS